jgi:hypothetical protein
MEFSTNENRINGSFFISLFLHSGLRIIGQQITHPYYLSGKLTPYTTYDDPGVDSGEGDGGRPTDVTPDSSDRSIA